MTYHQRQRLWKLYKAGFVLRELADGKPTKQIAVELGLSRERIRQYRMWGLRVLRVSDHAGEQYRTLTTAITSYEFPPEGCKP